MTFIELKEAIELATGLSQDALHIYAAVLVQLVAAGLSRRGLAHPGPWLCVLVLELANEGADIVNSALIGGNMVEASLHDLWNTMLVPTVLLVMARLAPGLFRPSAPRSSRARENRGLRADQWFPDRR